MKVIPPFRWDNPNQRFRSIAFFEGISYLLLLVTMVLKYQFDMPEPNKIVGSLHGFLFVLYVVALLMAWIRMKWKFWEVLVAFFLSFFPIGTFIGEAIWWHRKG